MKEGVREDRLRRRHSTHKPIQSKGQVKTKGTEHERGSY